MRISSIATNATIIGYRHLCDQLEAENQVLRIQIQELRSRLWWPGRTAFGAARQLSEGAAFFLSRPTVAIADARWGKASGGYSLR